MNTTLESTETTSLYEKAFCKASKASGSPNKRKRDEMDQPAGHLATHSYCKSYDHQKPCTSYCAQPNVSLESWSHTFPDQATTSADDARNSLVNATPFNGFKSCLPPPPKLTKKIKTEDGTSGHNEAIKNASPPSLFMAVPPPPLLKANPAKMELINASPQTKSNKQSKTQAKYKPVKGGDLKKSLKVDGKTVSTSTEDHPANHMIVNTTTYQSSVSKPDVFLFLVNFH